MKEKILIVEDDKFLGEFLLKRLKEEGFEVFLATNGEEGFNLACEKRPELIILDLILPEKNGYEVLEDLKRNPLTSNIPVLILSNLGQKEEVEEALRKGAEDFLIKAYYSLDDITLRVRLHLKKSKK